MQKPVVKLETFEKVVCLIVCSLTLSFFVGLEWLSIDYILTADPPTILGRIVYSVLCVVLPFVLAPALSLLFFIVNVITAVDIINFSLPKDHVKKEPRYLVGEILREIKRTLRL